VWACSSRLCVRSGVSLDRSGKHSIGSDDNFKLTLDRFPQMIENVGLAESSGVTTALIVGVSIIPTAFLQWRGSSWRPKLE
jgi:hypothetical protein